MHMIKHIVMWQFNEILSIEERVEIATKFKQGLESLVGVIDGVIDVKVIIDPLDTSNRDILLDSSFESVEAMAAYQVHPEHNKIVDLIKGKTSIRSCIDYQE